MNLRPRSPREVRRDAIRMAIGKAVSGCSGCASSYFSVARKHGATDKEISSAVARAEIPHGMSRRKLMQLALATGAAAATAAVLGDSARATSFYWGTDSNGITQSPIPQDFYIGRFGYGLTSSTQYFNTTAASNAGFFYTYEYWGLVGPASRGTYTPYNWGSAQGQTAVSQWYNNGNASYVGGHTIFADVEAGFGGWSGTQSDMQAVLNGFLDYVANYNYSDYIYPGVYVTAANWASYFGTSFGPNQRFVLWLAGCRTCGFSPSPCSDGSGCMTEVESIWNSGSGPSAVILGYCYPQLWQYWISNCSCTDYNVADYSPYYQLPPKYSLGTIYSCSNCGSGGC